jgi:hypothetical protein
MAPAIESRRWPEDFLIVAGESSGRWKSPHSQELNLGRRDEDLAESAHPVAGRLFRFHAAIAELIELIQAGELDLELQRRAAWTAREWHQQAGIKLLAPGGFDLAMDEVDRTLAIYG